jgi:hypothetical protein
MNRMVRIVLILWGPIVRNLTGHIAGHYRSAVSLMYVSTGPITMPAFRISMKRHYTMPYLVPWTWKVGDTIDLVLPLCVSRVKGIDKVAATAGQVGQQFRIDCHPLLCA